MSNSKYKIVYCAPAIYTAGGVERVVSVKASYFAEVYGYDVTIIITEGPGLDCFFPLSPKVKVINLRLGFEELWKASFVKKIVLYLRKQRKYRKLLAEELMRIRPDFTISVLRREINFINSIKDGSIKLGELHVNRSNYRNFKINNSNFIKDWFARFWMKNLVGHLQKLERVVVLTETAKTDWPELPNICLIPDPLPFKVETSSNLSAKRVVCIGRYCHEKGIDLLLHVWANVEKVCSDWILDIFGMGEQTPYLELMEELGIDKTRCHLFSSIINVKEEYLTSSIFALPSRFEGFGLVIIEAMSCGLPVISFDCENGPRNIITDSYDGFLIPPFDVNQYAEKMICLIHDKVLRQQMGQHAYQSSNHYNIDAIGYQWKLLFDELMQNK